jgi:hypothetical protein
VRARRLLPGPAVGIAPAVSSRAMGSVAPPSATASWPRSALTICTRLNGRPFMTAWSEMLFASVLTDGSTRTLAAGLQEYATQNQVYWNQIMAVSLTVSVPIVVGFLLLQRFLVAGMTAGSVK